MDAGKLVPDSVVIGLVEERLAEPDAKAGFILDGFPRTVAQADALGALLERLDRPLGRVLQIDVPQGPFDRADHPPAHGQTNWTNLPPKVQSPAPGRRSRTSGRRPGGNGQKASRSVRRASRPRSCPTTIGWASSAGSTGWENPRSDGPRARCARALDMRARRQARRTLESERWKKCSQARSFECDSSDGREVLAGMAPRLRHAVVRLIAGSKVRVDIASRDPSRGQIVEKLPEGSGP